MLLSESGTSVMAFFLGALGRRAVAQGGALLDRRSLDHRSAVCGASWRSALQARLGELDVAAAARRCRPRLYLEVRRRRHLSKAAHRHRLSAARATCISRSQPTPTLRAPPKP